MTGINTAEFNEATPSRRSTFNEKRFRNSTLAALTAIGVVVGAYDAVTAEDPPCTYELADAVQSAISVPGTVGAEMNDCVTTMLIDVTNDFAARLH